MAFLLRYLVLALLLLAMPGAVRADDIAAASRGVVRVVTIAIVDGQVVGFGHGSGFAIAPDRIVTNAHVVELAERYPDDVVIGIVPSEGAKSYQGRVVSYDAQADLALIAFDGARLPPATLYTGPAAEGDGVVALGYPGNVDLATARSAADYIVPTSPVRSEGVFSGRRALSGVEVLLHTASIARGNSGGPLLDRCGRVIGVNSAITRGEDGDAPFGFAIADSRLARFLAAANQRYSTVGTPCTSIEDRLRADSAADARALADSAATRREAQATARIAHEEALAAARAHAERARENVMAFAGLLLVGGALALGGSGLLASRGSRTPAICAAAAGATGVLAAIVVFVLRPSAEVRVAAVPSRTATLPDRALGKMVCRLIPERSRVTISSSEDVTLDWGSDGCMNARTRYVEGQGRWERILVPDVEQTVSALTFDPVTRLYTNTRYLMSAAGMAAARAARSDMPRTCAGGDLAAVKIADRQSAIRSTLPPLPNEKLVYSCAG